MLAISTTEFRNNLRKYLNLSNKERIIIQCGKDETYELVPSNRISDADRYMSIPENAAAVRQGITEINQGKGILIDPDNIWDSI